MDFFERAHIPRKSATKMENKPNEAVKRQLKQMMNAYKQGNNQDIRNCSEIKPNYDFDETISVSDYSDVSATKSAENSIGTVTSNASDDPRSLSSDTSKSISMDTDGETQEGSSEDLTECCEEFKALSTSIDDSLSTSFNSAALDSSDSNDSELSIPSSLQISSGSGVSAESSDIEFDADGILASKILEKLSKNDKVCSKRKIPIDIVEEVKKSETKESKKSSEIKNTKAKQKKNLKKPRQDSSNKNSTHYFLEEDVGSDFENILQETQENWRELKKDVILTESKKKSEQSYQENTLQETQENWRELKKDDVMKESKKKKKPKQSQHIIELSDESIDNSMDSISTKVSLPFVSVSAEDMSSQSLSDLIGDYVHPTIRNLPTDQTFPIKNTSSMFSSDDMIIKDVIDDEISSLIPEVDEELALEDLNIDTDTQDLIKESNRFNDKIPTEDTEPFQDMTTDSMPVDDTVEEFDNEDVHISIYNGNNKYVLVMKHPAELYIHGKLQVADINGLVEIFGYKLNYDSIEVYAPYCNFAYCLRTLENPHQTNPDLLSELTSAGLSGSEAKEIVSNIEENTSVIMLSKLNSSMIDFVDNNFSTAELFSKRSDNSPRFLKKAADSLGCSFYLKPPKRTFEEKTIWDDVYTREREGSRGIICGGKGTGKSTFLRHYVNTLLADGPVLVIDLDPGQAEFTVPGNISATVVERPLIGPNFTHLKCPEKMLNIGIINTMDNANRYLSAVSDLIAYCRASEDFCRLPWIVNTMGLCNHMGLKFMTSIILQLQPTFLFQIDSKTPKKRFDVQLDAHTVTQLYEKYYSNNRSFRNQDPYQLKYSFVIAPHEETAKGFGSSLLPRDERYLNILAYFGELLNEHRSQGLMEIVPYEVNLKDMNIGLNIKIPADSVAKVINGKIIALCQQKAHDKGQVFTLRDKALLCHGHGLIRGIDFEQGLLYVLTPTHIGQLASVDTLVYSDWMPELRGLEHDLPSGTAIPYRTANTALHQRKLMFPPRRRFNPLQLLRMSRNS